MPSKAPTNHSPKQKSDSYSKHRSGGWNDNKLLLLLCIFFLKLTGFLSQVQALRFIIHSASRLILIYSASVLSIPQSKISHSSPPSFENKLGSDWDKLQDRTQHTKCASPQRPIAVMMLHAPSQASQTTEADFNVQLLNIIALQTPIINKKVNLASSYAVCAVSAQCGTTTCLLKSRQEMHGCIWKSLIPNSFSFLFRHCVVFLCCQKYLRAHSQHLLS